MAMEAEDGIDRLRQTRVFAEMPRDDAATVLSLAGKSGNILFPFGVVGDSPAE